MAAGGDLALKLILQMQDEASDKLKELKGTLSGVGNTGNLMKVGLVAGTAAAVGLAAALGTSIRAAAEAQLVEAQLDAVLRSTAGAAGMSKDALMALATQLGNTTMFEDEMVMSAESMLLTFTNISSEVFPAATTAVLDMAQAMGGDPVSAAIQLGKALNDPINGISALTRVGVTFSDAQKEMIAAMVEAGDTAGAQKLILAELSKEFGGSAVAAGSTFSGQLTILKNSLGNVAETIGGVLLPGLTSLTSGLVQTLNNPDVQAGIAALAEGIGEFLAGAVSTVMDIVKAAMPIIQGLFDIIIGGKEPMGDWSSWWEAIAAVLGEDVANAVTNIGMLISDTMNVIRDIVSTVMPVISGLIESFMGMLQGTGTSVPSEWQGTISGIFSGIQEIVATVMPIIMSIIQTVLTAISSFWNEHGEAIINLVKTYFQFITNYIDMVLGVIQNVIKLVLAIIHGDWQAAWDAIKGIVMTVWDYIVAQITTAINLVKGIIDLGWKVLPGLTQAAWDAVKAIISGVWDAIKGIVSAALADVKGIISGVNLAEAGANIMRSVVSGIQSGVGAVLEAIKNAMRGLIQAALNALLSGSPSQAFVDIGRNIMVGLANGIAGAGDLPIEQLRQMIKTILALFKGLQVDEAMAKTVAAIDDIGDAIRSIIDAVGAIAAYEKAKRPALAALDLLKDANAVVWAFTSYFRTWNDAGMIVISLAARALAAWSSVFDKIKTLVDGVKDVAAYQVAKNAQGAAQALIDDARAITRQLVLYLQTWQQGTFDCIALAAKAITAWSALFANVRQIVDGVKSIASYQRAANAAASAQALMEDARAITRAFVLYLQTWQQGTYDCIGIATKALTAWSLMFAKVKQLIDGVGEVAAYHRAAAPDVAAQNLINDARAVTRELVLYFLTWQEATYECIALATRAATAWGAMFTSVRTLVDGVKAIADYHAAADPIGAIQALIEDARVITRELVLYFLTWEEATYDCLALAARALTAWAAVFAPIRGIIDGIKAIAGYTAAVGIAESVKALIHDIDVVRKLLIVYFLTWTEAAVDAAIQAGIAATAVGQLFAPVRGIIDTILAIAGYQRQTNLRASVDDLIHDVDVMRKLLVVYFRTWSQAALDAVVAAGEAAAAVGTLFAPLKTIVAGIMAVSKYQMQAGLRASMDNLIHDIDAVRKLLVVYFRAWSQAALDAVVAAGEAMAAVAQLFTPLKGIVDGIQSVADYQAIGESLGLRVLDLLLDAREVWEAIVREFGGMSEETIEANELAARAAEAAAALMSPVKGMVDAIKSIAHYQAIGESLGLRVLDLLLDAREVWEVIRREFEGWGRDLIDAYSLVADAMAVVGRLFTPIKGIIDGLAALMALPAYNVEKMAANIAALNVYIEIVIVAIADVAARLNTDAVAAAAVFSEAAGKVFSMVKTALDALDAVADFGTEYITPQKIDVLIDMILYVLQSIAWAAYQLGPEILQAAAVFAQYTQSIFEAMKAGADMLNAIADAATPDQAKIDAFVAALRRVLAALDVALDLSGQANADMAQVAANLGASIPPIELPQITVARPTSAGWPVLAGRPSAGGGGGGGGGQIIVEAFGEKAFSQMYVIASSMIRNIWSDITGHVAAGRGLARSFAAMWAQGGIDSIFSRPTLIGVGEAGAERVQVTPLDGRSGAGGGIIINFTYAPQVSLASQREAYDVIAPMLAEVLRREARRG